MLDVGGGRENKNDSSTKVTTWSSLSKTVDDVSCLFGGGLKNSESERERVEVGEEMRKNVQKANVFRI